MKEQHLITKEGLAELEKELTDRKTNVREQIADEIEKAREQGDLSENSAYKSAMENKEFNEVRITQLEETIKSAVVVAEQKPGVNKAGLGSKVKVKNKTAGTENVYELVGQTSADPSHGKISIESPLGKAMLNKKKGASFKFTTPSGDNLYSIEDIN